jgi:hypothetical protein
MSFGKRGTFRPASVTRSLQTREPAPSAREWFARLTPLLWIRPVDAKGKPLRPIRTEYRNSVEHIRSAAQKPQIIQEEQA